MGVRYIPQLFSGTIFKSFRDIQDEFAIPRTQFYQYLQLRHAIQSETRISSLASVTHPLMADVMLTEDRKGMISRVYARLIHSTHDASNLLCRKGWEKDLGPIDGETWELCLASAPLASVSTSHKLLHIFLLHRVYRTPTKLQKWGLRDSPICPKCDKQEGDLLHMMWKCPKLFRYWQYVLSTISQVFQFPILNDPVVCLLGALGTPSLSPNGHTVVLTGERWIDLVNNMLIREKITYQHRNVLNHLPTA